MPETNGTAAFQIMDNMMKKILCNAAAWVLVMIAIGCSQGRTFEPVAITAADLEKAGNEIPTSDIGEPVGTVRLYAPRWVEATGETPAYGVLEGSIFPVDPDGWPINFRVLLPATWSGRSMQSGGGGNNGIITVREGNNPMLDRGFAIYGSDAGHQVMFAGGPPGMQPAPPLATGPEGSSSDDWALNEEAIRNLGYMQMKKTHDAVMVVLERVYGEGPQYNYYVGSSQGGREGLMVAQRYPEDYDGIISNVPIVNFSTLMLAPELIRIQEKPQDSWVTPAKVKAITAEFLRQCDGLDGLSDGIISNYIEARTLFNVNDGVGPEDPWAALRGPGGMDPDPADSTAAAKLSDGQIKTLELTYSTYNFSTPLANGVTSFGMWLPNVTPDAYGLISSVRYRGQEGAGADASMHTHLGILGVTGMLMQDLSANPLDYVEGGQWNSRREEISEWLDATDPDLSAFYKRGGKIIITIGTGDNLASDGAQLDYYQSLIDKMGRSTIDDFSRLYVVPQGGHGLSGRSNPKNGEGEPVESKVIPRPDPDDNMDLIMAWVERNEAPPMTLVIHEEGKIGTALEGSGYLLCSYPNYPRYMSGPPEMVSSYECAVPQITP
jgi:feruloyl esterase